jgi:hypothetical protein
MNYENPKTTIGGEIPPSGMKYARKTDAKNAGGMACL